MTPVPIDRSAARALWERYCAATGADASSLGAIEHFGDSPEMADGLVDLVVAGVKTATAGLERDFTEAAEPLPDVGGHWIVVDGRGTPRCVLRSTQIRFGVLASVDDSFAWDEGEIAEVVRAGAERPRRLRSAGPTSSAALTAHPCGWHQRGDGLGDRGRVA